jgi:transcription elongation factor GreA-like protein/transcription elongation GreA/GreB family factor
MGYLRDFRKRMKQNNYYEFLKLWEEYCHSERVDEEELYQILKEAKDSSLSSSFGSHVDRIISLWKLIEDKEKRDRILRFIIDIQTTNTEELAELTYKYLKEKYGEDKYFLEKIRLIGLRARRDFTGAISKYELLTHLNKGKFVFHKGGWGTGEILDLSLIREEMSLEFEYVVGKKHLTFEKALNTVIPLSDEHFLARRFGNPDFLEKRAKEDPVEVILMLLSDLGPKTALEIKEELCDLVIPEDQWAKWWQIARSKIKKSTKIEIPKNLQKPFKIRKEEVPHEETLYSALESKPGTNETIQLVYSFVKDFPETLKNREFKANLHTKLKDVLLCEGITISQKLQVLFLLESLSIDKKYTEDIADIVSKISSFDEVLEGISIISFKKKLLSVVKNLKGDWSDIFLKQFFSVKQNILREYILVELEKLPNREGLEENLKKLLENPVEYPTIFVWYFQKILKTKEPHFLADKKSKNRFFESFMILLDHLYQIPKQRDLMKKMVGMLTNDRYKIVRNFMAGASLEEVREFLLLSTKCTILTSHQKKIIQSLGEVVYPTLKSFRKEKEEEEEEVIWTTKEGYENTKKMIERIATVEMMENAREIEEARALGDLRENAEYKAALEKRGRLQGELKMLSDSFNKARILTKDDVNTNKAGVGTIVECEKENKEKVTFVILGPWDAKPEENILSFQSNLAKEMSDLSIGDVFSFQDKAYTIKKIFNFFD